MYGTSQWIMVYYNTIWCCTVLYSIIIYYIWNILWCFMIFYDIIQYRVARYWKISFNMIYYIVISHKLFYKYYMLWLEILHYFWSKILYEFLGKLRNIVLFCIILYYIVWHCTIMILYAITWYYTISYNIVWYFIIVYDISPYFTILYYSTIT